MCAQLQQFGDIKGKTVKVYTGIVAPEDALYQKAFDAYTQCTGAKVQYEGDKSFEAQVLVRVKAGNPPDIAIVPQPGLLKQLVATGKAVEAPKATADNVDKYFGESWKALGSVDGKFYAGPNSANVKSLVWYSPKTFADNGWAVPTTLDELKTLSDKIVASGKMKPWCAGIGSGDATGWPVTDWMEDMMLRLYGADTYDKWVNHAIPFNGPESTAALDAVGAYLKNDAYVNGGYGNVKSIATTTFQNGGLPILTEQVRHAPAGQLLRDDLPEGHDGGAGRRRLRVLLPGQGHHEQAGARWWRVHARLLRQERGAGLPDLHLDAVLREPACAGRELTPAASSARTRASWQTSLKTPIDKLHARPSCRTRRRCSGSTAPTRCRAPWARDPSGRRRRPGSRVRAPRTPWTRSRPPGRSRPRRLDSFSPARTDA